MTSDEILKWAQDTGFTRFLTMISGDHRYIHEKKGFSFDHEFLAVAAAGFGYIGMRTPAASVKRIHFRPTRFSSSANLGRMRLKRAVSFTGGTELIPFNNYQGVSTAYAPTALMWYGVSPTLDNIMLAAVAGGDFGNQPAGDGLEIISDSASDVQECTIYGTKTGALTTVTSETVTLTGVSAKSTALLTWQNILGVVLSVAAVGTVTIREASGNATVTTITAAETSAGVVVPTSTEANTIVPLHDADGASTKAVGVIGTDVNDAAISSVDAMNGTTEEDHGTKAFKTITMVLIGDVAAGTDVTFTAPARILETIEAGSGGGNKSKSGGGSPGENEEIILEAETDYVFVCENIGSVTASNLTASGFFYEEHEEE